MLVCLPLRLQPESGSDYLLTGCGMGLSHIRTAARPAAAATIVRDRAV
jgi:hypothetical protein